MVSVGIKRSDGLGSIVDSFQENEVEITKDIHEESKNELLEILKRRLEDLWNSIPINKVFSDEEINRFIAASIGFEEQIYYSQAMTFILQDVVRKGYDSGKNNFKINLNGINLKSFGWNIGRGDLNGGEERLLSVELKNGCVGENCGFAGHYLNLKGEKTGSGLGKRACYSSFIFDEAGEDCGFESKSCYFELNKGGDDFGYRAKDSVFLIKEEVGSFGEWKWAPSNSIFKTPNKDVLEKFLKCIPEGRHNKIVLVRDYGSERIIREN